MRQVQAETNGSMEHGRARSNGHGFLPLKFNRGLYSTQAGILRSVHLLQDTPHEAADRGSLEFSTHDPIVAASLAGRRKSRTESILWAYSIAFKCSPRVGWM